METARITEGSTDLIVPAISVEVAPPPRNPAFFNPKASRTRDMGVRACGAHLDTCKGPKTYLDAMCGTGARGIRMAHELDFEKVFVNDLNPEAIRLAKASGRINGLTNVTFSEREACGFLASHSGRGERGSVVDVDPFGSPAPYIDCAVRAAQHGGMLSVTATDLQVLGGLHNAACMRIYGGVPIRTHYGTETAVRIILGCVSSVSGRLGKGIEPLYVESHMHYYRTYVRVLRNPSRHGNGYLIHCSRCGHRQVSQKTESLCDRCHGTNMVAGPLWTGNLFDEEFVERMMAHDRRIAPGGVYGPMLEKCLREARMPPLFCTLDEVAARIKAGPPSLRDMIAGLEDAGFVASPTSFAPNGFRTNASFADVCDAAALLKSHAHQI